MTDALSWHPLHLPSQGRFYGKKPGSEIGELVCPNGAIEYRLWTTEAEETLARYGGSVHLVDKMIEGNIRLPEGLTYADLLVADQFFILMKLRSDSLCPFFSYQASCTNCAEKYDRQANLQELTVLDKTDTAEEPMECFLPHAKVEITLRYPRVSDSQFIAKLEAQKKGREGDGLLKYQFARQIISVDGNSVPFLELKDWVNHLTMMDLRAIGQVLDDNEIGYDLKDESECPRCGQINDPILPVDESFFRPRRTDVARAIKLAKGD
jgi:hypothetical protein